MVYKRKTHKQRLNAMRTITHLVCDGRHHIAFAAQRETCTNGMRGMLTAAGCRVALPKPRNSDGANYCRFRHDAAVKSPQTVTNTHDALRIHAQGTKV